MQEMQVSYGISEFSYVLGVENFGQAFYGDFENSTRIEVGF